MFPISEPDSPLALAQPNAAPGASAGAGVNAGDGFAASLSLAMSRVSGSGPRSDSRHLSLSAPVGAADDFQERAADILAQRQQLLASNIANADTPNYKARDIDLRAAMQAALGPRAGPLTLQASAAGHIAAKAPRVTEGMLAKFYVPAQGSVDGNTVEMDTERGRIAENTLRLQFSLDRVKDDFKNAAQLLNTLKG